MERTAPENRTLLSDGEIVRRVLAGRRDDYAELVRRYLPLLEAYLAGRGLRGSDIDEAAQSAFVIAYRRLGRLWNPDRFGRYLLKVASHCWSARPANHPDLTKVPDPRTAAPDEPWKEDLQAALAQLPEAMQILLAWKYGENLTAAEIADRLGQTVGSVTKTLSRAYALLRANPRLRALTPLERVGTLLKTKTPDKG